MSEPRSRLAVLGSPIAHSKSPVIQRAAYAELGLDWRYEAVEMTGERLPEFLASLDGTWRGLSLTMPLKRDVLPLLDRVHPLVTRVGGANTVLFSDGAVEGFNTDVLGTVASVRSVGVESLDVVHLLGAGATAASVLVAVAELGARRVVVSARTPAKAAGLIALGAREGVEVVVQGWGSPVGDAIPDLVVSTVPGGQNDLEFTAEVRGEAVLFDVAYDPWPSSLARAWQSVGGTVVSGLELLLQQAVGQLRVFVGGDPDRALPEEHRVLAAMRAAVA